MMQLHNIIFDKLLLNFKEFTEEEILLEFNKRYLQSFSFITNIFNITVLITVNKERIIDLEFFNKPIKTTCWGTKTYYDYYTGCRFANYDMKININYLYNLESKFKIIELNKNRVNINRKIIGKIYCLEKI